MNSLKYLESIKISFFCCFSRVIGCIIVCFVCRLDSGSSDTLVYFEMVTEVPSAQEQGKSYIQYYTILIMLNLFYKIPCFLLNCIVLEYHVGLRPIVVSLLLPYAIDNFGYN